MAQTPSRASRSCVLRAAVGAILALAAAGPALGAPAAPGASLDELLVGFHAGVPPALAEAAYTAHGAARLETLRGLPVHRVRVPAGASAAIARALGRRPEVAFVEPNHLHASELTATDPSYTSQWHLPRIAAPQAWDITTGSPTVVIAILDSGVDPVHPDLAAKLVPGYNVLSSNTDTHDVYGHGTKVAGAAAALANNGTGGAGVAWQSRVMPIRVSDSSGYATSSAIANGLTWAVDHGARVMNLSFNGVAGSATITSAAKYVRSKGGVVVAAAGNCGCLDATLPNTELISVSATDSGDNLASFSSLGNYVDLAAPGVSILTTTMGGGYASVSGTSFASPITAGVLALMMAANPGLSPTELETLLKANADDRGIVGWDPSFGYGRLNAYRAVAAAQASPADSTPPTVAITSPSEGSQLVGTVTVAVSATDTTPIAKVDLYVDGALHATDTSGTWTFAWDTTGVPDGSHALVARALDAYGNAADSPVESVAVRNAPDTTAPTVAITSVKKTKTKLAVGVTASDDTGVTRLDLYLDSKLAATCTPSAGTCSFTLPLGPISAGSHALQAKASDAAGNAGASPTVAFVK